MLLYRTRMQFFLLPCAFCRNTFFPAFLSLLLWCTSHGRRQWDISNDSFPRVLNTNYPTFCRNFLTNNLQAQLQCFFFFQPAYTSLTFHLILQIRLFTNNILGHKASASEKPLLCHPHPEPPGFQLSEMQLFFGKALHRSTNCSTPTTLITATEFRSAASVHHEPGSISLWFVLCHISVPFCHTQPCVSSHLPNTLTEHSIASYWSSTCLSCKTQIVQFSKTMYQPT